MLIQNASYSIYAHGYLGSGHDFDVSREDI